MEPRVRTCARRWARARTLVRSSHRDLPVACAGSADGRCGEKGSLRCNECPGERDHEHARRMPACTPPYAHACRHTSKEHLPNLSRLSVRRFPLALSRPLLTPSLPSPPAHPRPSLVLCLNITFALFWVTLLVITHPKELRKNRLVISVLGTFDQHHTLRAYSRSQHEVPRSVITV
jgi:hypothetical protein